jgi:phosphoribosylamine---glycine ligase
MKVLIIGSGGREHAILKQVQKSPRVSQVYCAPGNPGMQNCERVDLAVDNIDGLLSFALEQKIDLTIVGPELPLTMGIVDTFQQRGLNIFGPSKAASQLEGSKDFTKEFCVRHGIATAGFKTFTEAGAATSYVQERDTYPIVIKADGLAAGKGVIIAKDFTEAEQAIDGILVQKLFGDAGQKLVVEDFIKGQEASFIIIADGEDFVAFPIAQDHKAAFDRDEGPNTGGMGAYAPASVLSDELRQQVVNDIIKPSLKGMIQDGASYCGFLYAGIMIPEGGKPQLLEYNCRLGDPEAQVMLPLLKTDFVDVLEAALEHRLADVKVDFHEGRTALCVVLASEGYPGKYEKGRAIAGLDQVQGEDAWVIHAGTTHQEGKFVTSGGRVLAVTVFAEDLQQAIAKAYENVGKISWPGMHYRRDIGKKGL